MLDHDDFPLFSVGNRVYVRTQSSPVATCQSDEIAKEIAARLNAHAQLVG